ncbi:KLH10 protein, partial [Amia calva]|nr:KLH10 protein [Amia calva]
MWLQQLLPSPVHQNNAVLGLMQACFLFLEAQLSPEDCIGICQFAEFYSPELQQAAYRYLLHHFGLVAKTSDEFLALSLDQLLAIINQEGLNVQQDHVVVEAIMRWIAHAPSERHGQFSAFQSRRKI